MVMALGDTNETCDKKKLKKRFLWYDLDGFQNVWLYFITPLSNRILKALLIVVQKKKKKTCILI